jgi:hypothetical protein
MGADRAKAAAQHYGKQEALTIASASWDSMKRSRLRRLVR